MNNADNVQPLQNDARVRAFFISRLLLRNFRNYDTLRLELGADPVVLNGNNGSGKTNILEAVSFLSPGKGLRKIKLTEVDRVVTGGGSFPWSVSALIHKGSEDVQVGTGRDRVGDSKRIVKINGDVIRGQAELANVFSVMWLTPQMDGLFIGSSSDRRKFLDRLVYNFDPSHASRIYSYEYTMRERAKLLQENADLAWIDVLESKMAERSVSIAAARIDAIEIIQSAMMQSQTVFPKAIIAVEGNVEEIMLENSALHAEEVIKQQLFDARVYDTNTGRTSIGTHRSDFIVTHAASKMPAASCSTGEQKALLLSIILAEARAKAIWKNSVPVLLLDEVVAHLDEHRRISLFNELLQMKAQVWMTGTDVSLFCGLEGRAQFFTVNDGIVAA